MNADSLFRKLEPPPGGAERFAQRLDETSAARPAPRSRMLALAAAIAAVAFVVSLLLRQPSDAPSALVADTQPTVQVYDAPEFDRLLGRSSPPAELAVKVNTETANVTEIETTNQKVRIYQID